MISSTKLANAIWVIPARYNEIEMSIFKS